jgi:hypothetical protein
VYGFAGGGLPPDVKTVAVLPFENFTSEPTLTQDVNVTVRDAVEGRLGLRSASERQADAVVRGTITRYDPDLPVAYTGTPTGPGQQNQVQVTKRQVELTVTVEIINQKTGATLWSKTGMTVQGDYSPGQERDGRRKALERLADNIVEGAQSQW